MNKQSRSKTLGKGLLAGLVAAMVMTLVMLLLRYGFGIATPAELIGDRIAALLSVETFLSLLNRVGGYNELKQLGVVSVVAGQLAVGALGGLLYAVTTARGRTQNPERAGYFASNRRGLLFLALFVGALWVITLVLLYPLLGTHYEGRPQEPATFITALGLLFSYAVFGLALLVCYGVMASPAPLSRPAPAGQPSGRRAVLVSVAGVAVAAAVAVITRRLYNLATFSYDGTQYKGADVQGITPNERFYVVTKNVVDPRVDASLWRLEVAGMVERPQTFRLNDLIALPPIMQETTLRCISNQVGGGLMSNAVWKGVPLRRLLEAAAPRAGVVEVLIHGVDNYTDTFSFEKAMEETTLVAYEMNGVPLPQNHGYPARIIVPGLYGEKNIKWVTRIELVDHDAKGFYEKQGWGPNFVMPTTARFDVPEPNKEFKTATTAQFKGVAHAGNRGVRRVEVSADDGRTWQEAKLDYAGTPLSWALWSYDWRPARPGEHKLRVRATDGAGALQTAEERGIVPEGATGYHQITVQVKA